jgi:uncharacterized membrane protein YeaQ/YmgE (transglycosylase-associated protein family)
MLILARKSKERKSVVPRSETRRQCGVKWQEDVMSIIVWLVLGAAAGFVTSRYLAHVSWLRLENYLVGILGAVMGGVLSCHMFGGDSLTTFDATSILMAASGAVIGLLIYNIALLRRVF